MPENRRKYDNKSLNLFFRFFGFFFLIIYYHTFFSKPKFKKRKKRGNNSNNYNCFFFVLVFVCETMIGALANDFVSLSHSLVVICLFSNLTRWLNLKKNLIRLLTDEWTNFLFVLRRWKCNSRLQFEYFNCVTTLVPCVGCTPYRENNEREKEFFFFKSQQLRCESL